MAIDFAALEAMRDDLKGSIADSEAQVNKTKKLIDAEKASGDVRYTLFASGLNFGGRDVELKDKNFTDDLAIIFDVVENHTYTRTVNKSSYAAENKVNYSDHAVIEDGKFSFSARVAPSPLYITENNYIDKDTDDQNPASSKRPEKALDILERIIVDRRLVTLVTEDRILDSYILTSLSAKRENSSGAALVFDLEFTQFRTFILGKTVLATVYSDPKKSGSKSKQKGAVGSSATSEDIEVTARKTRYVGPNAQARQELADKAGYGNNTMQDVKAGTLSPNGTFKDLEGKVTDYDKIVGN